MKTAIGILWKIFGGTKLVMAVIEWAIGMAKAKWPDMPIPDATFWQDVALLMYSIHSGRDLWAVVKTLPKALAEYYKTPKA